MGVTPYLTREAFLETARVIASLRQGTGVVFDFAFPPSQVSGHGRAIIDTLSAKVAAVGEPFRLFLDPAALPPDLHVAGFSRVEVHGVDEINARYGLRLSGKAGGLAEAWV